MEIATLEDLKLEQYIRKRNKVVWKTKSGNIIPLKDLTDEHLNNIINCKLNTINITTEIQPSSLNFY